MKPDTFATTYIPPHAIQCWCDDIAVYTAVPTKSGPPLVQKYSLTEGGLSKALAFLRQQHRNLCGSRYKAPIQSYKPAKGLPKVPETSRETVRELLRRRGII